MSLKIVHNPQAIDELVNRFKQKQLNLEPAFQRRSVWKPSHRSFLIQSLLEGIPLPSIYLYKHMGAKGKPIYDVIDGKQRMESILLFMNLGPLAKSEGELTVTTSFDAEPSRAWSWKELPLDKRYQILGAKIPTIEVEGDFGDIVNLFVRINSTGTKLTGHEKRHAQFLKSPVLKTVQQLAEKAEPGLIRQGILTKSQAQRMRHAELIAELLLAVHTGRPLDGKSELDRILSGKSILPGPLENARKDLVAAQKLVGAMLPTLKTTRFRRLADYYSLVVMVAALRREGKAISLKDKRRLLLAGELLIEFARGVDQVSETHGKSEEPLPDLEPHRKYLLTTTAGTDKLANRKRRQNILAEVLEGVFEDLDPKRTFNATQRRILWHGSAKKICCECGETIVAWEDLQIDHILPYIRGGKTVLKNAGLIHKWCNESKGAD